ncbi:hypothetical protein EXIGLDRAFT_484796 [Exidia glandulosa HHB12029]|uniref:Uncharacterized protein n=1 Tax=Exidia glandulosa HHB12029 TaxID=1314781 RepID=A0A165PKN2_EXIGL|nr:hypothetical protein EXIGLDRAFT_484796 [Exidia glandulosa HHB12029]
MRLVSSISTIRTSPSCNCESGTDSPRVSVCLCVYVALLPPAALNPRANADTVASAPCHLPSFLSHQPCASSSCRILVLPRRVRLFCMCSYS